MKRTGIRRSAPLRRGKGLARGGEITRHVGLRRSRLDPKPGRRVPGDVRSELIDRAGPHGRCEIGRVGCAGRGREVQHRVPQGSGGVHGKAALAATDRLANLLWACSPCHDWVTGHPAESKRDFVGWTVEHGRDPSRVAVLYRQRVMFLDDFGGVYDYLEVGT